MAKAKAVPKRSQQSKRQNPITKQIVESKIGQKLESFMRGRSVQIRNIDGEDFFVLESKSKVIKLLDADKNKSPNDVQQAVEIVLISKLLKDEKEGDKLLSLLAIHGDDRKFKFFSSNKSYNTIQRLLSNLNHTIVRQEKDKSDVALTNAAIKRILARLDVISETEDSDEKLARIENDIQTGYQNDLATLTLDFKSLNIPGYKDPIIVDGGRFYNVIQVLLEKGAFYPKNGMTSTEIIAKITTECEETSLLKFLDVKGNKDKAIKIREQANLLFCRDFSGNLFYLAPGISTNG